MINRKLWSLQSADTRGVQTWLKDANVTKYSSEPWYFQNFDIWISSSPNSLDPASLCNV